ncbi:CopG antitoxin of type II toxin-antitoxin system [Thermodesulfitimonas autotrophica]|uniref:CopG antitoxin of type II toxin-antitoxin system n=1 Tax=Thermodesulfitimonas autotrophica TaxID=1894989 RepID=A0A3N5AXW3_9THEO|nr:ribbon-helix-helix protein, CopG family [Thermodesulfitimonas autotrophica]RPF41998.1 CopG antitoxin of type II toxin-antitoxin system [Thermodesulfitimonas autotrophica]
MRKTERLSVTLPAETAERIKTEAARRHVSVSSLVALAVERLTCDLEAAEFARRAEVFARACLLAALRDLEPEARVEEARRLLAEATAQIKRMEEKRR